MTTSKLPLPGLLALSLAAFITVLTEALPAGLLSGNWSPPMRLAPC